MVKVESLDDPRLYYFLFHLSIGYAVLAAIFGQLTGCVLVLAAALAAHFYAFDQLPNQRLSSFASLIYGSPDKDTRKRVVLHRGGCIDAPENTLEAIREAARQGAAGVEFDLQFTSDSVGILMHDDTLDRTTDGVGDVRQQTFQQIRNLDASAKHANKSKYGHKVKIPTLEECLLECLQHRLLIFIDCKAYAEKTAQLVDKMMNKYPELYECAAVCSFYPHIVYTMRKKNPNVITGLTYRKWFLSTKGDCWTQNCSGITYYFFLALDVIYTVLMYGFTWMYCGNSFLLLNKESVSMNEVNWWKNLGITLLPWTVNSETEKRYFMEQLNVPIITDGINIE
ncbi:hypothetical protein BaRGS_00007807 [Batillaria attramentaria]|uniref:GP-PDE domain-containing protein n=1 Tax=Batillaria attramentaria TaxID=370345 RepID=A0ABD0LMX2_9CAEN